MEALEVREHMDRWNDDRLDELSGRVDAGFAKVDQEMKAGFAQVNSGMTEGFAAVDKRLDKIDARFEEVDERFERLYRLLFISAISIVGVLIAH